MKRFILAPIFVLAVTQFNLSYAFAQQGIRTPRASQKATVTQTVGVTDVTVTFSRPGVKGRAIWGDPPPSASGSATLDNASQRPKDAVLVPYGHVWRAGANEATQFIVTDDVLVNGQPLKAGTYSLHMIPAREEWTIIFNSDAGQWGSFSYDAAKDVLRIKAKPQAVAEHQEWMLFSIDPVTENSAQVSLRWEKLSVPFTVEIKDVNALTIAKARAAVAAAKPDDWRTPLQAANFAFQNGTPEDRAEAMRWIEQSVKIQETFQNMGAKARMLAAQGKTAEAIAAGEKAVELGKAAKANTADLEKRLAEWKDKK